MTIITTHAGGQPNDHWTETVEGATPNSVEVSLTAKGQAQVSVKLYYATAAEMAANAAQDATTIIAKVRAALAQEGITLAGQ